MTNMIQRVAPREDGPGVYNNTIRALRIERALALQDRETGHLKPKPVRQAEPMTSQRRVDIYGRQNGGGRRLTPAQMRRGIKKMNRESVARVASRTTDLTANRNGGTPA